MSVRTPHRGRQRRDLHESIRVARGPIAGELASLLNEAADRAAQKRFADGTAKLRQSLDKSETAKVEALWRGLADHVAKVTAAQGGLVIAKQEAARTEPARAEAARIDAIVKASKLPTWAKDKVQPWLDKLYESAFVGTYSVAQDHLTSTQKDAVQRLVLKEGGTRLGLIDIADDVRTSLFRVLEFARNWEAGQPSPRQVATWIRSEVPAGRFVNAGPRYRAQLIARTEIMHATRVSQLEIAKADPFVKTVTAMDGDQDEECAFRNGTEYSFSDADAELLKTHPNCVLSFVPTYVTT